MANLVQIIGKPDCHLCEQAQVVVARVCADLGVSWEFVSIFDQPNLADLYAEFIPVVLVDGKVHDQFGVNETRLRAALS
ncbi:MAG: glutaredoxin family protein [Actinobacteria bacterium]|nr:glutaredoxin family protein [Actinomycetota bacterium]